MANNINLLVEQTVTLPVVTVEVPGIQGPSRADVPFDVDPVEIYLEYRGGNGGAGEKSSSEQMAILAQTLGTDVKKALAGIGDLGKLDTNEKTSLVLALNELNADLLAFDYTKIIADNETTEDLTWSSVRITEAIKAAISALIADAPETLDTLKELADAITANQDAIEALRTIANGHVKYDAAQTLTEAQKAQARQNVDAASIAATEQAQSTADAGKAAAATAQADVDELKKHVNDNHAVITAQLIDLWNGYRGDNLDYREFLDTTDDQLLSAVYDFANAYQGVA